MPEQTITQELLKLGFPGVVILLLIGAVAVLYRRNQVLTDTFVTTAKASVEANMAHATSLERLRELLKLREA